MPDIFVHGYYVMFLLFLFFTPSQYDNMGLFTQRKVAENVSNDLWPGALTLSGEENRNISSGRTIIKKYALWDTTIKV